MVGGVVVVGSDNVVVVIIVLLLLLLLFNNILSNTPLCNICNCNKNCVRILCIKCPPPGVKNKSCILRFFTGKQGKLRSIQIQKELINPLKELEYGFFVKPNDTIGTLNNDNSRLGYLISIGKTWEEALRKANIAEYAIKFDII